MQNVALEQNILRVQKFLDAAIEPDMAEVLARLGLDPLRLESLSAGLIEVKTANLKTDLLLSQQKDQTARKAELKQALQLEIARLIDLIRSEYAKDPILTALGLASRYETVTADDGKAQRRPGQKSQSEASQRSRWTQLLDNIDGLAQEPRDFLAGRGWGPERITQVRSQLEAYAAACEARDSTMRLYREQSAILNELAKKLETTYRSYSRQVRREAGRNPLGLKLKAMAAAL